MNQGEMRSGQSELFQVRSGVWGWLLVLGLLVAPRTSFAVDSQRPLTQALLRIWQVQQGLPRAAIFAIHQTADGYVWLGTQAGLFRFDGVQFTSIVDSKQRPLTNLWIQDLEEDADHNLWIATDNVGLVRLRDGVVTYFDKSAGLPSNHVRCLHVDQQGRLWIGTDSGLAHRDGEGFTVFHKGDGLAGNEIRALGETTDGALWIACEGRRVCVRKDEAFATLALTSIMPRESVQALLGTKDGTIWIGTSHGVIHWVKGQQQRFTREQGLADDWVNCLTAAGDGSVWVGTKDGLSRLRGTEIESFSSREGLSQSTVYSLWEDYEGSLWAGTKLGLNQFVERRTLPFTVSEGLPSNDAGPVVQDGAGSIWVGTLGAGLARFDGRHFSVAANAQSKLPSNNVLSLAVGKKADVKKNELWKSELWIGTDRGLSQMRDGQIVKSFTVADGLPSNVIRCVCWTPSETLWVGTPKGVAELREQRFRPPDGKPEFLQLPVQALVADGVRSVVLAAEGGGLYQIADGKMKIRANEVRVSRGVDAFYRDESGYLWTAVRGSGLGLLDGYKSYSFTVKDGLYDDDIFGIVADNGGRMWMACSRGIFSVDRKELLRFAAGEVSKVTSSPFSPTEALRTIECRQGIQPAVTKMSDGNLWFSTIRGVIVVDPVRFQRKLTPPPVLVEQMHVNGHSEFLRHAMVLPPGRTNVDFHYTALSFIRPTRVIFRYMLEGFDKNWILAGTRRDAYYTNLPPGDYRFRVAASYPDGSWNESPQPVAFRLQPHFYQTRWFIPVLMLFSVCVGWVLFRLRVRQIKLQLLAVLAERSRIARELHDTLIQGFSGVTMQMQGLTARLKHSPERQTLEDIIHDAGDCLREARHSVAGLRSTTGDESGLTASIAQAVRQLTEASELVLHLRLGRSPAGLTPDAEYNILRIVHEAASNAVRHSGGRKLEVTLSCSQQQLEVSVHDDGIGFDLHELEPTLSGHYGLIGMRERAAHIRGKLSIDSQAGRGTTVSLTVPLAGGLALSSIQKQLSEAALEISP